MLHITYPRRAWHEDKTLLRMRRLRDLALRGHFRDGDWTVYRHGVQLTIVRHGWNTVREFKGYWHRVMPEIINYMAETEGAA